MTNERPGLESSVLGGLLSGSSLKRRLLSGSIWAVAGRFGGAMVGILTASLLTFVISPKEVGAYNLVLTIVSFGALVGALGLPKTVVRLVAENVGLNRSGRAAGNLHRTWARGRRNPAHQPRLLPGDRRHHRESAISFSSPSGSHRAGSCVDSDSCRTRDYGRDVPGLPRHPLGHPSRWLGDGRQERWPDNEARAARHPDLAGGDRRRRGSQDRHAGLDRSGFGERVAVVLVTLRQGVLPRLQSDGGGASKHKRGSRRNPVSGHRHDRVRPAVGGHLDISYLGLDDGGRRLRQRLQAGHLRGDAALGGQPRDAAHRR